MSWNCKASLWNTESSRFLSMPQKIGLCLDHRSINWLCSQSFLAGVQIFILCIRYLFSCHRISVTEELIIFCVRLRNGGQCWKRQSILFVYSYFTFRQVTNFTKIKSSWFVFKCKHFLFIVIIRIQHNHKNKPIHMHTMHNEIGYSYEELRWCHVMRPFHCLKFWGDLTLKECWMRI
jgi:hypothetical protein